ncbi:O-antigen ligase family protein [Bradyrhizobium cajani]|uniref:Polymerase n=1 Tax=Bradyrhizobium cajani TaxID=1928661 RepID=A0A844TBC9_9BRAD|nr:O-antigen ligase family protein [Bradyrhizobium cajani]MCP3369521.1 O-antigen ligase family protein [Bradyrhizobium cajani]MVT71930.1 polymerase [Bradyrhizobium cajani]
MIGSALLALGLVLGTASQLRLPGFPLGIGEACLAVWLGLASLQLLTSSRVCNPTALLWLLVFWTCFIFIQSFGAFLALLRPEIVDPDLVVHDIFAYLLVAAVTCLAAATLRPEGSLRDTLWFLIGFWIITMAAQLALGWGYFSISSVNPWYWDRFRGWSENPNQLAIYCAVLTPLSLHMALTAKRSGRFVAGLSCIATFVVGRLTKSDTFLVSMSLSIPLFVALRLRTWLTSPEYRWSLRFAAAAIAVMAIVPLSLSLLPYGAATAGDVGGLAAGMMKDRGGEATRATANLRLSLWQDALHAGLESGSLGLGPGPHLEKPSGITDKGVPLPLEAHSTLLDVFTQGGLLGVIAVLGLLAGTLALLLRARLDALAVLILALAFFSISHFILRHPTVWFAITLGLILGSVRRTSAHARIGS